jgi:hypothetical protein
MQETFGEHAQEHSGNILETFQEHTGYSKPPFLHKSLPFTSGKFLFVFLPRTAID